jgi:hypothetical protein
MIVETTLCGSAMPGPQVHWLPDQRLFGEPIHVAAIELEDRVILSDGACANEPTIMFLQSLRKPVAINLSHGPSFNQSDLLAAKVHADIFLHEADRVNFWLRRKRRHCRFWSGDSHTYADGVEAIHVGGHSPGHSILFVAAGGGTIFAGDALKVAADSCLEWDRDVRNALRSAAYAEYLRRQIGTIAFDVAVSLHGGPIADAGRRIHAMLGS